MDDALSQDNPTDGTPAAEVAASDSSVWTAGDQKVFLVTIVTAVASNVATLLLVGTAVAFVRLLHPKVDWTLYAVAATVLVMAVVVGRSLYRLAMIWLTRAGGRTFSRARIFVMVCMAGVFLECLLILVGLAAGVK